MHRTKSVNFYNKIKVLITYKQYILFLSFLTEENSSFVKSLKFITILLLLNINTRGPVIERFCNRHITRKVNLCNRDVQSVQKNHCKFPYNPKDWIKLISLQYTCCLTKLQRVPYTFSVKRDSVFHFILIRDCPRQFYVNVKAVLKLSATRERRFN